MTGGPPRLESTAQMNRLMREHYAQAVGKRTVLPVAWVNAGAPVELLRAMEILPVYPENYAAMCGASGAVPLCEVAEAQGYSRDLCSYARISLGATLTGSSAPLRGLGRPDLVICCSNSCSTIIKWFEALARLHRVPFFVVDTPFLPNGLPAHALAYVAGQLEDLVRWLESTARRHLDANKLESAIAEARETMRLWREIRELCRSRPSPLNAPDLFLHMAPIVVLRGTPQATAYYRQLREEVAERVRQGVGGIPDERFRLLWDNIAIWPKLSSFYGLFARRGACFVADTYTGAWDSVADPRNPFESLARAYLDIFLNRSLAHRIRRLEQLIRDYACDGLVMHNNRSCKPFSLGEPLARHQVTERTGVPGLLIEADMCDTRAYADEQIATRVQAFLEALDGRAA